MLKRNKKNRKRALASRRKSNKISTPTCEKSSPARGMIGKILSKLGF